MLKNKFIKILQSLGLIKKYKPTQTGYSENTMLTSVFTILDAHIRKYADFENIEDMYIYLNKKHQPWWINNIINRYSFTDITAINKYNFLNVVPTYETKIIWLNDMNIDDKLILLTSEHIPQLSYTPRTDDIYKPN